MTTRTIPDKLPPSALDLVREAGCECKAPHISAKPGVGPRCTQCGTQVVMVNRGALG